MLLEPAHKVFHIQGTAAPDANGPMFEPAAFKPILLPSVLIQYVLFEVPMAATLEVLPVSLHPSIPSHMCITGYSVPDSPVGAFELCVVGLGCRSAIKPRLLTDVAFVNSQAAADFLRDKVGFRCQVADVRTTKHYDSTRTVVRIDGTLVIELATWDPQPLLGESSAIKYSPALNPVSVDGREWLAQVDLGFQFKESGRGKGELRKFDPAILAHPQLEPNIVMAGTSAIADMEIHNVRFLIDPTRLPSEGGVNMLR